MRADLQEHLHGCEHCEVTLNTTRKTIQIYRSHEIYEMPPACASACTPPSWRAAKRAAKHPQEERITSTDCHPDDGPGVRRTRVTKHAPYAFFCSG